MHTLPPPPHRGRKLLALLLAVSFLAVQAVTAAPKVDALRATQIATEFLRTLGAGAPYIESVTLEKTALVGDQESWVVHWSKSFVSGENTLIGLRVKMDGSTAQLAVNKEARRKRAIVHPR
jgi:hypothetical protein